VIAAPRAGRPGVEGLRLDKAGSTPARGLRLIDRPRGERVASVVVMNEREAEAVRLLDALQRDDAAIRRVRNAIGWIW